MKSSLCINLKMASSMQKMVWKSLSLVLSSWHARKLKINPIWQSNTWPVIYAVSYFTDLKVLTTLNLLEFLSYSNFWIHVMEEKCSLPSQQWWAAEIKVGTLIRSSLLLAQVKTISILKGCAHYRSSWS